MFDSSSKHTFKAKTFVGRIGVSIEDLYYKLTVSTPTGVVLTTKVCVRGVTILIEQCIPLIDFTMLLMREFDAIFSMD